MLKGVRLKKNSNFINSKKKIKYRMIESRKEYQFQKLAKKSQQRIKNKKTQYH